MELNPYGFNFSDRNEPISYLFVDANGNPAKIIINENKEIYILDKNVSIDVNGNIINSEARITATGNAVQDNSAPKFDWSQIDNRWIGVIDKRSS
jgi:hypothetical protein